MTQSTETFTMMEGWIWKRLWRWSLKRHKKAWKAKKNCFSVSGWKFGYHDKEAKKTWLLNRYDQTKVRKYVKIKPNASVYDRSEILYLSKRLTLHHPMFTRLIGTLDKQKGRCAYCQTYFRPEDIIELHHPLDEKGKRIKGKLEFVHNFCHDKIHQEKIAHKAIEHPKTESEQQISGDST